MPTNSFENKCSILAELWMNYRDDDELEDFISYNDIGLPLAYLLHNEIVLKTELSNIYIEETYNLLLEALGAEDKAYESLDELLGSTPPDQQ